LRRVKIHGDVLAGYFLPLFVAVFVVFVPVTGILARVWANPVGLKYWMIYWALFLVGSWILVAQMRRTFIEADADRVRWFFRQPRAEGDEPLANLTKIELLQSGAVLVFPDQVVMADIGNFSRRSIKRLVAGLQDLGVQIGQPEAG
jgi:hypothetical protein